MTKTYTTTSMDLSTGELTSSVTTIDFCDDCINPIHLCICENK